MGNPLIPPPLLLTKLLSLGAIAMISTEREQLQAIATQFFCHMPQIQFLAIFHHLCLLMGDPLIPPLILLTKILSLGDVAMKSTERKLLQAITTPFFRHMPQIQFSAIFGLVWPFLAIFDHFCPLMNDPMIPSLLLFTKMLPLCILLLIIFHTRPISTRQLNYLEDEGIRAATIIFVG